MRERKKKSCYEYTIFTVPFLPHSCCCCWSGFLFVFFVCNLHMYIGLLSIVAELFLFEAKNFFFSNDFFYNLAVNILLGPLHVIRQVSFGCWITWSISSWQNSYKSFFYPKTDLYQKNYLARSQWYFGMKLVQNVQHLISTIHR